MAAPAAVVSLPALTSHGKASSFRLVEADFVSLATSCFVTICKLSAYYSNIARYEPALPELISDPETPWGMTVRRQRASLTARAEKLNSHCWLPSAKARRLAVCQDDVFFWRTTSAPRFPLPGPCQWSPVWHLIMQHTADLGWRSHTSDN